MLIGINQKDPRFIEPVKDSGCLFLCFAHASPVVFNGVFGVQALNALWNEAVVYGYINDRKEVVDHNGMLEMFGISERYDGKHHDASETIPSNVSLIFGKYRNGDYTHFVVIDRNKKVILDPLGRSNTVANGYLEDMRWYYAG